MITSREYDQLCKVTDELRTATEALYTAGVTGDIKEAARQFVVAEDAWEAFTSRLVEDTATTATDADGWIEWDGGDCPVTDDTPVDIRFRTGTVIDNYRAGTWDWDKSNMPGAVVAYRVVS